LFGLIFLFDSARSSWKTLVPSNSNSSVDDVDVFEKFVVLFGSANGRISLWFSFGWCLRALS
jgi:hypothetical protein